MRRSALFNRQPALVREDVFLHGLQPSTLDSLREATEHGLMPTALDFTGDNDSIVILSFTRPSAGEARPMVIVEFNSEENEVTGKVYDAKSLLKYAPKHCDAHRDGSVRGTVSRLLRDLAARISDDPSF
ncbi:MAG TPA: hypothetical protein VE994_09850 [Terriglobales bacterium]|nr:hypothetical protein [Terriglobales bacterium]